jgi:alginate O-acetyltransferase complex protein AlgI
VSFVDPAFVGLLTGAFALYWALPTARAKNAVMVLAGTLFYGWLHPWMALLMLCTVTFDYLGALAIERWRPWKRPLLLLVAGVNLGVLGAFKYLDWVFRSLSEGLAHLGLDLAVPELGWLLPLGISFYTFQSLGYVLDVYRGDLAARRNLVDFLAFAVMFPPLLAGPLERARRLLPQLERDRQLDWSCVRSGLTLAAWGAFMKVVIADTLAPYLDAVGSVQDLSGIVGWSASFAFGVQLYADFAGYTHLARGLARMFGLELVENFDHPFLATSTPDFWRRWHISLSSWLRDYLLAPLLGSGEVSPARLAAALTATFLVIGVWHGAGWHYAAFGLWHAGWSLLYLAFTPYVPESWARVPAARWAAAGLHIALVLTPGSFLFRGPTVPVALQRMLTPPWQGGSDDQVIAAVLLSLAAVGGLLLLLEQAVRQMAVAREDWLLPVQTTTWAAAAVALVVFHPLTVRDFVYFRF